MTVRFAQFLQVECPLRNVEVQELKFVPALHHVLSCNTPLWIVCQENRLRFILIILSQTVLAILSRAFLAIIFHNFLIILS